MNTMILIQLLVMAAGFLLLIKGADFFVKGASTIAHKLGVPQIIIGLTIVAMGTSAPEAAVSISAACSGNADITIGNVVGSNTINVLMILGITALVAPIAIERSMLRIDIPFTFLITLLLAAVGLPGNSVNRLEGILILAVFSGYLGYLFRESRKNMDPEEEARPVYGQGNIWTVLITLLGLGMIIGGSQLTVWAATQIALALGVSQRMIGLTIVAFGTSLPELVTSVTAARLGHPAIAMGNIIGSNIFNILFVTGLTAVITPVEFISAFAVDTAVAAAAVLILWLFSFRSGKLGRLGGGVMLACYAAYFAFLLFLK